MYGDSSIPSAPKRPKFHKEAREERIVALNDEVKDIARLLAYKEKSLSQAECACNYKLCEKITEELMALKSRRRDLKLLLQRLFSMPVPMEWDRQTEIIAVQHVCKGSKEYQSVLSDFHQTLPEHRQSDSIGFRTCGCGKNTNTAGIECS